MATRPAKAVSSNEWEDVTDEWESVTPGSSTASTAQVSPVDKPWYKDAADIFLGFGGQAAKYATLPAQALTALGVPGYKGMDYSMYDPRNPKEQIGSDIAKGIPYALTMQPEAALAGKASSAIRSISPGVYGVIKDWLARGAIGAGGSAASALVNQEKPADAAIPGAVFPMASQPLSALSGIFKRGAQTSMGKAVGANYVNRSKKFVLENIIDPLIKEKHVFWTLRQLEQFKRESAAYCRTGRVQGCIDSCKKTQGKRHNCRAIIRQLQKHPGTLQVKEGVFCLYSGFQK